MGLTAEQEDARAVADLVGVWDVMCPQLTPEERAEFVRLQALWQPLRALDPIAIDVDLLSPLGQQLRETSHTQALGYLLDPRARHGLEERPLAAFLNVVDEVLPERQRAEFQEVTRSLGNAAILLERASVLGTGNREGRADISRTDLWIELPADEPKALVVVEAKVTTTTTPGQLARYDELIADRIRALGRTIPVVRIYLTPWGDEPDEAAGGADWLACSFFAVAAVLRWELKTAHGPGAEFLRLYLATVFQKVLKIRWSESPSRFEATWLLEYLRLLLTP